MKRYFLIIPLLVVLVLPVASRSEQKLSVPKLRAFLVGTWEIFKLPPASGPLAFDPAGQLGKKIVFSHDSFNYDKAFMFFPERCQRARFAVHEIAIPSGSIPSEGSLNFQLLQDTPGGLGPVRAGTEIAVSLACGGNEFTQLDVSRGGFLAIYWDTGFFYLKKIRR